MSKTKKIPNFKTEAEEREFWEIHDSSDYIDWKNAHSVSMSNLKPSTKNHITQTEQQDKWVTVITIGYTATISPLLCSSKTARLHL